MESCPGELSHPHETPDGWWKRSGRIKEAGREREEDGEMRRGERQKLFISGRATRARILNNSCRFGRVEDVASVGQREVMPSVNSDLTLKRGFVKSSKIDSTIMTTVIIRFSFTI